MPSLIRINDGEDDDANEKLNTILRRLFQSGNLNFIFGSGASMPAINIGGNIETQIQSHFDKGEDAVGSASRAPFGDAGFGTAAPRIRKLD